MILIKRWGITAWSFSPPFLFIFISLVGTELWIIESCFIAHGYAIGAFIKRVPFFRNVLPFLLFHLFTFLPFNFYYLPLSIIMLFVLLLNPSASMSCSMVRCMRYLQ